MSLGAAVALVGFSGSASQGVKSPDSLLQTLRISTLWIVPKPRVMSSFSLSVVDEDCTYHGFDDSEGPSAEMRLAHAVRTAESSHWRDRARQRPDRVGNLFLTR